MAVSVLRASGVSSGSAAIASDPFAEVLATAERLSWARGVLVAYLQANPAVIQRFGELAQPFAAAGDRSAAALETVLPLLVVTLLRESWDRIGKGGVDLLGTFFGTSLPGLVGSPTAAFEVLAARNPAGKPSGQVLQACLTILCASATLYARVDSADAGRRTDGKVGTGGLGYVVDHDTETRSGSLNLENAVWTSQWLAANPGASDAAKALARSLGWIEAYASFFQEVNPVGASFTGRAVRISIDVLRRAVGDPGLPTAMREAAAFWSKTGVFTALDLCGENTASHQYDGYAAEENIKAFFEDVMPDTDAGVAAFLATAARIEVTVPHQVRVSPSLFQPSALATADPAVKAAALMELQDLKARLASGASIIGEDRAGRVGIQIDERIALLAADVPTQDWLRANELAGVQALLGTISSLRSAIERTLFGPTFKSTLLAKIGRLTPESAGEAAGLLELYRVTTGKDYRLEWSPNLLVLEGQFRDIYAANFVTGADLSRRQAAGVPFDQALAEFTCVRQILEWALSSSSKPVTADQAAATLKSVVDIVGAEIGNVGKDSANWKKALALVGLAPDASDAEIRSRISKYFDDNPEVLAAARQAAPEDGGVPTKDEILAAIVAIASLVRGGFKLDDAIKQVNDGQGLKYYRAGTLHIAGAALFGLVIAVRSNVSAPAKVAASMQIAGQFLEGGAKALQYDLEFKKNIIPKQQYDALMTKLKLFESFGKAVGGFGGVISGGLTLHASIVAFKRGDILGGVTNAVSFLGQHASASAMLADVAINVGMATGRIVKDVVIKVLLARLAAVSAIGSAVSILATAVQFIVEAVLAAIRRHAVGDNVLNPLRDRYGIDTR